MSVSVIIVNYNAGAILLDCVHSVIAAKHECDIVVVDNASSDQSIDQLMASYSTDPSVRIVRSMRNEGFAVACNRGARLCQGEFLLFLNPDCILAEGALTELVACLDANPRAGMAGGLLRNPDGSEQAGSRRAVPTPMTTLVSAFHLTPLVSRFPSYLTDFNLHQQALPEHAIEVPAISGACMLVRRSAYEDVGGLDENYFLHCEDLDWCMRFGQKGWRILFAPNAAVVHHQGACSRARRVFVEWHKHKGMMRFYRKFFQQKYPSALMWLVAMAVWGRFCVMAATITIKRWYRSKSGDLVTR